MKRKNTKKNTSVKTRIDPNRYPKGWNAQSIKALAEHYDNQSEDDAVAEDEAAYRSTLVTMMAVPVELVPQVHKLIAKRAG
jgi:organic radical activating enzyme